VNAEPKNFKTALTAATATCVSGFGQSDTHTLEIEGAPNPHPSAGTPYASISNSEIARLVREPQSVPKVRGQWFIPSTYCEYDARSHRVQAARGSFWLLTLDVDQNDLSLDDVRTTLANLLGSAATLIYSSRSAAADCRKWRALVPLAEPLAGNDYPDTQNAFFDLLEEAGGGVLIADRALARPGQLVYLPNRGEHYEWHIARGERLALSPDHPIIVRREAIRAQWAAAEAEARKAREKRAAERRARAVGGETSPVEAFNAAHDLAGLLERFGYDRAGGSNHWRSPMQTSGSYATRVYDNSYWVSLSASDAAAGIGRSSGNGMSCHGDGFDLFSYFEHHGDFVAAVRSYAKETGMSYDGGLFAGGPEFDWQGGDARRSESASGGKEDTSAGADTSSDQRSGQSEPGWTAPDARFLRTVLPEPPTLPLDDVFSPGWARWIRRAAEAKGSPADYVVAALLSTAGALIGSTRWAAPWEGWSEVPIIWAMAIGNPSSGKSPGIDAVLAPLRRIEREQRQAAEAEFAEWAKKADVARLVTSTWKEEVKAALKSGDTVPEKPSEADPGPEPLKPRYALADATVEKIAVIVSAQPRGTLLARDELSGWLGNMSRYSGGSDRPFWLEAYGGRGYNVERMGRESIWIDHLSVGVLGGIQPDKLKTLLIKTDDDGLLARFLPVWPNPAPIKQPDAGVDNAFIDAALQRLLTLGMVPNEAGDLRPWFIPFAPRARDALNEFRVDARRWEESEDGLLLSFIGKLPGLAVRLALILAYLDWAAGERDEVDEIGTEYFCKAAHFIEAYALPMARRAYADGSLPKETRAATKLAAIIIENRWERFTTSDVLRLNRSGLDTKADLDPALDALETGSLIRALNPKSEGRGRGRPSRTFLVNPKLSRREP